MFTHIKLKTFLDIKSHLVSGFSLFLILFVSTQPHQNNHKITQNITYSGIKKKQNNTFIMYVNTQFDMVKKIIASYFFRSRVHYAIVPKIYESLSNRPRSKDDLYVWNLVNIIMSDIMFLERCGGGCA